MPDIILRVRDEESQDFYRNCAASKAGDVIVVLPDGWEFSGDELTLPEWRIVRFPVKDAAANDRITLLLETFLAPELADSPLPLFRTRQAKAFSFDLASPALPADLRGYLADDSRKQASFTLSLSDADLEALLTAVKVRKPRIADPAVLGNDPAIIG